MNGIEGKVVVITGASSGIGEAAAVRLAQQGAKVVLGARREDRIQDLVKRITAEGGAATSLKTDVTSRQQVQALADHAMDTYGRIDVWVNNAGIMPLSFLNKLKVDEWERMVDVNIKGVLFGIAAALPVMERQQAGHFINVASVAGHQVGPSTSVYSGTKHAVRVITEGLRQEQAANNIRTTIISPGSVETELRETITDADAEARLAKRNIKQRLNSDDIAEAIIYAVSQPEHVAINEILVRPTTQI